MAGEIVATTKAEHAKRLDSESFDLQCKMLGKAIILAANYNHVELLHTLFQSFIKLLSE